MKKSLIIKSLVASTLIAAPFLTAISCNNANLSKSILKKTSAKYTLSNNEIFNSKYSSNTAVNSQDDSCNVTIEQLNHRISAIEDKTQYALYAVGLNETDVRQTIGLMKKNISNKISEEISSNKLHSLTQLNQDSLNIIYSYVNSEGEKFGVNVIDFDRLQHDVPSIVASYELELINSGFDEQNAREQATAYKETILETIDAAEENLYDDVTYSLLLNEYDLFDTNFSYLKTTKNDLKQQQNNKDAELEAVLNWINSKSSELLSVRDEGLSILKDYSKNNTGLTVGDELSSNDITTFFNYKYNLSRGCDFDQIKIDHNIPEAQEIGEYNQNVINKTFYEAPLDTFTGYVPYEKNEIFPGYQLHAKIESINNLEDSHICEISFKFGISKRDDNYILWQNNNSTDEENKKVVFTANVDKPSNAEELLTNVAKNVYVSAYPKYVKIDAAPDKQGFYFDDEINNRTKLDVIMEKYKGLGETYDLQQNPVILEKDDYVGLDLPEDLLNKKFFTNQQIALIATDIDTNDNWLKVQLAIVDYGSFKNVRNDFIITDDIPFQINDKTVDSLLIKYDISKDLKDAFTSASLNYSSLCSEQTMSNFASRIELNKLNDYRISHLVLISAMGIADLAISILIGLLIIKYVKSFGIDASAVIDIANLAGTLALSAAIMYFLGKDEKRIWDSYKVLNAFDKTIDGAYLKDATDFIDSYKQQYEKIKNAKETYTNKKKAADEINTAFEIIDTKYSGMNESLMKELGIYQDYLNYKNDLGQCLPDSYYFDVGFIGLQVSQFSILLLSVIGKLSSFVKTAGAYSAILGTTERVMINSNGICNEVGSCLQELLCNYEDLGYIRIVRGGGGTWEFTDTVPANQRETIQREIRAAEWSENMADESREACNNIDATIRAETREFKEARASYELTSTRYLIGIGVLTAFDLIVSACDMMLPEFININ